MKNYLAIATLLTFGAAAGFALDRPASCPNPQGTAQMQQNGRGNSIKPLRSKQVRPE